MSTYPESMGPDSPENWHPPEGMDTEVKTVLTALEKIVDQADEFARRFNEGDSVNLALKGLPFAKELFELAVQEQTKAQDLVSQAKQMNQIIEGNGTLNEAFSELRHGRKLFELAKRLVGKGQESGGVRGVELPK